MWRGSLWGTATASRMSLTIQIFKFSEGGWGEIEAGGGGGQFQGHLPLYETLESVLNSWCPEKLSIWNIHEVHF